MIPAASFQHELELGASDHNLKHIDSRDPLETSRKPPGHPLDLLETLSKPLGGLLDPLGGLWEAFRRPLGASRRPLGHLSEPSWTL